MANTRSSNPKSPSGATQGEFEKRIEGWSLTTANVLYYMPDHPSLLQSFVWQTLDLAPRYPRVRQFLDHWRAEIEAVIHSVQVASGEPLAPARLTSAQSWKFLN